MPKNESEEQAVASTYWLSFLLQGIAAVIIGWLLLVNPVQSTLTLVVFLGLYWLITGIVEVVFSLFAIGEKGSKWGWKLLGGLIGIIAGLFVINNPIIAGVVTPVMLMYIIAFAFVINGIIYMAIGTDKSASGQHQWSWGSFFMGLLYLVLGVVLLTSPTLMSVASVMFAVAVLAIIGGIASIVIAFKVRKANK